MAALRIIFMGTPDLAAASLRALLAVPKFQIVAVVTQPDRPKGRDLKLQPSPVKQLALEAGLPVLQPEKARDEKFIAELRALQPELIAVAAFGQILPKAILDLPRLGCLNVHTSLLPKYRGASPIQSAILNGDETTGVTIMQMDVGLDTGDMLMQNATPIRDEDNAATLHDRLRWALSCSWKQSTAWLMASFTASNRTMRSRRMSQKSARKTATSFGINPLVRSGIVSAHSRRGRARSLICPHNQSLYC